MEPLGIIEEITAEGDAVVRSRSLPENGARVLDADGRRVGTVRRIFGPVDEPYVTVVMEQGRADRSLKGATLYFTGGVRDGKDKRRNR